MPHITRICGHCGESFSRFARPNELARGRHKFCSIMCANMAKSHVPAAKLSRTEKHCARCGETKPVSEFHRNRTAYDGYQSVCKTCGKAATYAYRKARPDVVAVIAKRSMEKHKIVYRKKAKAHRKTIPEKVKAWQRRADAKQYERKRAKLRSDPVHRAKSYACSARWAKENPDRVQVKYHRRRVRLKSGRRDLTPQQWVDKLHYFNNRCAYCLAPLPRPTMEHIQPLSRDGDHTDENVVPACRSCNSRKSSRTLLEWLLAECEKPGAA